MYIARQIILSAFLICILINPVLAMFQQNNYRKFENLQYDLVDGQTMLLDLYISKSSDTQQGLIVWIHGGLWSKGSKEYVRLLELVDSGYAIASINYRLSGEAPYPAQLQDCHAAIEWLQIHANDYNFNASKIIIAGESAGGHLSALAGLVPQHERINPAIKGIIVYYGASNLNTILEQSTVYGVKKRRPALEKLLGGSLNDKRELAYMASPVNYVSDISPPLLIFHGVQDIQMPINQAHELVEAYKEHNKIVEFYVINHAKHSDKKFYNKLNMIRVIDFLNVI